MSSTPNVEATVIAWLNSKLANDWAAYGEKPKTTAGGINDKYILVDRTGGPRESMVLDQAEILIEVYHKTSRAAASEMANEIADAVPELLNTENITRARVNSLVRLDDTIAQYYRYQIYCDVFNRR